MKTEQASTIRIFVGSPGDVQEERDAAFAVIDQLDKDHWKPEGVRVEGYGWDNTHYPKLVNKPPQVNIGAGLPDMATYDICIFILWSRLGTPLDETNFEALPDGRQPTGTEYEFHAANQAASETGRPDILLYRREQPFSVAPGTAKDARREALEQFDLVETFIEETTKEGSAFVGDFHSHETLDAFKDQLQADLKALVNRLFGDTLSPPQPEPKGPPTVPPAYLNWLKTQIGDISVLGLDTQEAHNVRLPEVYVPALTTARPEEDEQRRPRPDLERRTFDLLLTRLNQSSLYVPGAPGAGKSTFCSWVCWVVADRAIPSDAHAIPDEYTEQVPDTLINRLPLLCRLREFWGYMDCRADQGSWTGSQLESALCRWLDEKQPDGLSSKNLRQHLAQGSCLLMFDGFDEVPPSHARGGELGYPRAALLSSLKEALPRWIANGNRILLTSRPYGLDAAERKGFGLQEAELAPLPPELQELFIARWFHAADRHDYQSKADGLLNQLRDRRDLDDLRTNPMLLTALCVKFNEGKRLPEDIHDLYDAVVNQVLYNRYRDKTREVEPVRRRLGVVALEMHTGEELGEHRATPAAEITEEEIDQALMAYARSRPLSEGGEQDAAEKRENLLSRSGLLLPRAGRRAGFYHLSFQDFLAAERFLRKASIASLVERHAQTPQWHQTLVFLFAALASRRDLETAFEEFGGLKESLDAASLAASAQPAILLGRCLEIAQARGHLGEWADWFRESCYLALDVVKDPIEREALFVALGRLDLDDRPGVGLRDDGLPDIAWCPVGETDQPEYYIARYPVTTAQFQAFIDAPDGYHDRQWWTDFEPEMGEPERPRWPEANHPRTEVNWFDALAFCRWLSTKGLAACEGWEVTLPSDEQWRQAYVGETGRDFPWGPDYLPGHANLDEAWGGKEGFNLGRTSAVGLYPQGVAASGALDMAGNVLEWCLSKYADPNDTTVSVKDTRVLRGGSWDSVQVVARAAYRYDFHPLVRSGSVGFRLCCVSPIEG